MQTGQALSHPAFMTPVTEVTLVMLHSVGSSERPMYKNGMWARRRAARAEQADALAGRAVAVVVLALVVTSCGTAPAHGTHGASDRGSQRVALASTGEPSLFQTTRTFRLGTGRATRTFTFRERGGVILLNQLSVQHGVRAFVEASIPHLAGAEVWSWSSRNRPASSCRRHGAFDICTQSEEWCPMPPASWQVRLVKLGGPAGPIRFEYIVAEPPTRR